MTKLMFVIAIWVCVASNASADVAFGQVQSFIGEWQGQPVISANWKGRYRPYRWNGRQFTPLLNAKDDKAFVDVDFYSPLAIENGGILLSGQKRGGDFNLYFWHAGTKSLESWNIAPDEDQGGACVSPLGMMAFHTSIDERVGQVKNGHFVAFMSVQKLPLLERCVWEDEKQFWGVQGEKVFQCDVNKQSVRCALMGDAPDFDSIGNIGVGWLSARRNGDSDREIFRIDSDGRFVLMKRQSREEEGDALFFEHGHRIYNFQSRYFMLGVNDKSTQIFRAKKIRDQIFAVAADKDRPKSLAQLKNKKWRFLTDPHSQLKKPSRLISEIWLNDSQKNRYQSFYFGVPTSKRVVLWLHGGPHENISPRYSPYFAKMNQLGLGVLALNYPGSTGRGAAYEKAFHNKANRIDALLAARNYLRKIGVEQIYLWSVSSGADLALDWLLQGWSASGWIDQVGIHPENPVSFPRDVAAQHDIRYFSIRGRHDRFLPDDAKADFLYEDGHDITMKQDFDALFEKLRVFWRKSTSK